MSSMASINPMVTSDFLDSESGESARASSIQLSGLCISKHDSADMQKSNIKSSIVRGSVGGLVWEGYFISIVDRAFFAFQEKLFGNVPQKFLLFIHSCFYILCLSQCLICSCGSSLGVSVLINVVFLLPTYSCVAYSLLCLNFFYAESPVDVFGKGYKLYRKISIQELANSSQSATLTLQKLQSCPLPLKGNPLRHLFQEMNPSYDLIDQSEWYSAVGVIAFACLAFASGFYTILASGLIDGCETAVFAGWNAFNFFVIGMIGSLLGRIMFLLMLRIKHQPINRDKYYELLEVMHDASVLVGDVVSTILIFLTVIFIFNVIEGFLSIVRFRVIALIICCYFLLIAYMCAMVSHINVLGKTYMNCLFTQLSASKADQALAPQALLVDEHNPGYHVVALRLLGDVRLNFTMLFRILLSLLLIIVSYCVNYALTHNLTV